MFKRVLDFTLNNMKKYNIIKIFIFGVLISLPFFASAANYPLDIINIDEAGVNNRIRYAYPGIEYDVRIAATGGRYPFVWSLVNAPSGMTIKSSSGIITWSNPTEIGSPHTVTVRVTDDENNSDVESYTITVTDSADRFIFVSTSDDGTPTGSISDPYSDISQFWSGLNGDKIVYFRSGTHVISGGTKTGMRQASARIGLTATTPKTFLAYPSEEVIINEEYNPLWSGTCDDNTVQQDCQAYHFAIGTQNDVYFGGLIFDEIGQYGLSATNGGDQATFYNLKFRDAYTSGTFSNQSFINYMASGYSYNHLIANCTFGGIAYNDPDIAGVKLYEVNNMVVEDNYFQGASEGFSVKQSTDGVFIRHNHFVGPGGLYASGYLNMQGGGVGTVNTEIVYNFFDGTEPFFAAGGYDHLVGATYIEHNTIVGTPIWHTFLSNYGPIYVVNNVIQNTNLDAGDVASNGYYRDRCYFRYCDNMYSLFTYANNLLGDSGLVDSNGSLINRSYVGTYGWELLDESSDITAPSSPSGLSVL